MNASFHLALGIGLFGALAACSKSNDRPAGDADRVATIDSDQDGTNDTVVVDQNGDPVTDRPEPSAGAATRSATASIADSRCARELRCENIGPDKKYSSMDDCEARVKTDWRDDLNARECPSGIDREQLEECLDEIRNEDCANPFDTLGRVAACTVGQLCEG
jgi:hypothetical protein